MKDATQLEALKNKGKIEEGNTIDEENDNARILKIVTRTSNDQHAETDDDITMTVGDSGAGCSFLLDDPHRDVLERGQSDNFSGSVLCKSANLASVALRNKSTMNSNR